MDFKQLKNGEAKTNTGIKELAFDPNTFELRPVLFRIYSGYAPSRGTVQGVCEGDLIAQVTWNSKTTDYRIYRYGGDNIGINQEAETWLILRVKHDWMDAWLEPSERGETIIPENIIDPKDYLAVRVKRERIANALDRFGIDLQFTDFMNSKKSDLQLSPKKLDIDLDNYQPVERHWTGELVSIHQTEEWFGSTGLGKPAVKLEIDPEYNSGSNYAHDVEVFRAGTPGIKGWNKWRYIVRIIHGVNETNHSSWGKSFHVWENPNMQSMKPTAKKTAKKSKKQAV